MTVLQAEPSPPISAVEFPILTEGLTRRFGSTLAVSDLSMRVPRGRTYGFIGVNGAGKTTTIRMLMGLLAPSSGRALLRGQDVSAARHRSRARVGYVPDRCVAHHWMRVREAIAFCRRLQPHWNQSYSDELVKRFALDPRKRVGQLSKGMAAKLSLLLALAHEPEVLILDEPTDGLDPVAREDFLEGVLASVAERERTVLMSSHALADVERVADHIGLIHAGRLVIQCPTEELVATTRRIRLVLADGAPAPTPPPGALLTRREGREWVCTVRGLDDAAVEQVRVATGAAALAVEPLPLDAIFKDFVRGQESRS